MAILTVKNKALTVSITQTGAVKRTQLKKRKYLRDIKKFVKLVTQNCQIEFCKTQPPPLLPFFPSFLPSFFLSFCHSLVLV